MSVFEAVVKGCRKEIRAERRTGCGMLGWPQASVPTGRTVLRLVTRIRVCGSPVRVVRACGVRRGGDILSTGEVLRGI